jgi:ribonucleoside-diphosphate reductase alpha chain
MRVRKRDGSLEDVAFEKISRRLEALREDLDVDVSRVAAQVCASIHDGVSTSQLDEYAADVAVALATEHPGYGELASRILVSNLHKNTIDDAVETWSSKMGDLLSPSFLQSASTLRAVLAGAIDYAHDFEFDYFGFRTLERLYLTRVAGAVVERPQHMFARVAVALWGERAAEAWAAGESEDHPAIQRLLRTYTLLAAKYFTHASPTLFNAGMRTQQLSSCFLLGVEDDSIEGIFDAMRKVALISKHGGGVGLHVQGVRSKGSAILGTNGRSDGLVPMLRCFNTVAEYVNQGGRRKGSVAVYIEPHHPDIMEVLDLKRNAGEEHMRARDLFYAVWLSDIFMRRVEADGAWSTFDPKACPGLENVWGPAYDELYARYEAEGRAAQTLKARDVFFSILRAQIETGTPYILFKDAANAKSNQQNLGTIKCSNLCTEIIEYTSKDEVAVCNLASISLPAFVKGSEFDFEALAAVAAMVTKNLDRVIDITFYPIPEAAVSNKRHRPIGIGVQGLQDVFFKLRMPFDSPEARALNAGIFEALYYGACLASVELALENGPYETWAGSPAAGGKLQFDLWGVAPALWPEKWDVLKMDIAAHGMRNSLLVAPMPTASTSQLLGNTECVEPITSNIYSRRTLAGEFVVLNKYLVDDLMLRDLWTPAVRDAIIANDGSVQDVAEIPGDVKALYKTCWELSQKVLIDMAADRGAFVCQSQSLNLFVGSPSFVKLSSMHFYAWRAGLKGSNYYLRVKPAARAVQITVPSEECVACSA